jgi:glyoxylate reductase
MKPRLLVTGRIPTDILARLESVCEVDSHTGDTPLSPAELVSRIRDKHGVISQITERIDRPVLEAARELRVVANIAVGYDNIDVAAARERGVIVTNTPDVLTNATADFVFGLILAITRRLGEAERFLRSGQWKVWKIDFMLGMELRGKQIGIVGYGRIGRAVAERAKAFGMRIAYFDPVATGDADAVSLPLEELLRTSDVVSLHLSFSPGAVHLINAETLGLMKSTAFLVNVSRGPVVDEEALVSALRQGRIAGAALDVYEHEPHVHPDLLTMENVFLTPHIGSSSRETRTAMIELAAQNALAVLQGRAAVTPLPV